MDPWSARPDPAMEKAVPWSGEVRTKGNPIVTFTPEPKATVLNGAMLSLFQGMLR